MSEFIEQVFKQELEITFTKNWFSRQAMKFEKWLNSLAAWQIACLFISVFGGLCALMIGLDYWCSPVVQTFYEYENQNELETAVGNRVLFNICKKPCF
jgi:predicted anti-sigma-YlaC factor YlaD